MGMPDPSVEIADTLIAITDLLEHAIDEQRCLRCIELESEIEAAHDEIECLEGLLADAAEGQ